MERHWKYDADGTMRHDPGGVDVPIDPALDRTRNLASIRIQPDTLL